MSEAITLDAPAPGEQRTQAEPPRQEAAPAVTIEEPGRAGPSDADALRDSQAAIAKLQSERDEATRRAQQATQQATRAQTEAGRLRDEAARANSGRVAERRAALTQGVQAAKAELDRAEAAYITASESGDFKAAAEAQKLMASAMYRGNSAEAELAGLGDGPQDQPPQQQRQQTQRQEPQLPSPRVRQWLADHPRMDTDRRYRAVALDAHNEALELGHPVDSDQYFAHINRVVDEAYPAQTTRDPPPPQANGGRDMPANGQSQGGGHASQAAPPNRGGSSGLPAGWKPVSLNGLGTVNAQDLPNGGMRFNFPDQSVYETMEEGAKICYPELYSKDPKRAVGEYTKEQVIISRVRANGGTGGLTVGDGSTYR